MSSLLLLYFSLTHSLMFDFALRAEKHSRPGEGASPLPPASASPLPPASAPAQGQKSGANRRRERRVTICDDVTHHSFSSHGKL